MIELVLGEGDSCTDDTLLYYLMSGFHTSVNTHISNAFADPATQELKSNQTYFLEKVGNHKDRVKNLHFLFAAVVKAVRMMEPALLNYEYSTGIDKRADKDTELLVRDLIRKMNSASCDNAFKEKDFFKSKEKEET